VPPQVERINVRVSNLQILQRGEGQIELVDVVLGEACDPQVRVVIHFALRGPQLLQHAIDER
jgi:hypothetical protein